MNYFIALLLSVSFTFIFRKYIKKSKTIVYLITLVLSIFFCFSDLLTINNSIYNFIEALFTSATLATAFLTIVMFIGVLGKNSAIKKFLQPIRTQISFIACFLLIPHFYSLFNICYTTLLAVEFNLGFLSALISLSLFVLLILLFITSFKYYKIKLKAKRWKKIQQLSYFFFLLIYVHIILFKIPYIKLGYYWDIFDLGIYSLMFFLYFMLKFNKYNNETKKYNKKMIIIVHINIVILFILLPIVVSITNINKYLQISESTAKQQPIVDTLIYDKKETIVNAPISKIVETKELVVVDIDESASVVDNQISPPEILIETKFEPVVPIPTEKDIEIPVILVENTEDELLPKYVDGIYKASGEGYRDDITLSITISKDKITNIKVKYSADDDKFFDKAFATLKKEILNLQSAQVDTICCATYSSRGIIEAIQKALEEAQIK